jgi:hypothetical protein
MEVKRPGRKAEYSSKTNAEVKKARRAVSITHKSSWRDAYLSIDITVVLWRLKFCLLYFCIPINFTPRQL